MKLSNRFGNASLPLQFIVLLSLILIGLIISMLLIALSPLLIQWGIGDKPLLYLVMLIQSFGLFILPAYFTACLLGKSPVQYLHMDKSPTWFQIFAVILILFTATPMMNRIIEWNAITPNVLLRQPAHRSALGQHTHRHRRRNDVPRYYPTYLVCP